MKFGFVTKHRRAWTVRELREVLGVSRSGYYRWLARPGSRRELDDEAIGTHVRQSVPGSGRTYIAQRVWHDVLAGAIAVACTGSSD